LSRAADYTIKGFLYQFNKTVLEILNGQDDDTITIEGVIEDVEIVTSATMTAIQCKYHEASTNFTSSAIYKPLLQMLSHFCAHSSVDIRYVLFAHFPSVTSPGPVVGKDLCQTALESHDKALQKYIKKVSSEIDIDVFLKRFSLEFGPSYEDLLKQVHRALETSGILTGEIETIAYPNAINIVAGIAIQHDPANRRITRKQFLEELKSIHTTAISRWTMALHSRKKLLEARRKQLKVHLDKNTRLRYFVLDPKSFDDYEAEIILFISDYIAKYHFKQAHINTPILCICASRAEVQDIQHRLYVKGIVTTDGYVGTHFEESYFFRDPFSAKFAGRIVQREFTLRVTSWDDHGNVLNNRKCDDLFILGEPNCDSLETVDVNVERLAGTTIKEIKYVIGVSNVYE